MTSVILLPGLACDDELFAHQAEVYAAYMDYTDHEIGRMLTMRAAWKATGAAPRCPPMSFSRSACQMCRACCPDSRWAGCLPVN